MIHTHLSDIPILLMQTLIDGPGPSVARVQAVHCMDMIADETERRRIAMKVAGGEPIWWMTPGWINSRKDVFNGWDKGVANEDFPKHTGGAIVLEGLGYVDGCIETNRSADTT